MRARILVVDDEPDIVKAFRGVLNREEIILEEARSGPEAIAKIRQNRPDLVLLDLRLPGQDGLSILRQIHAYDPALLVIMMTAYSTSANMIEAMKLGAHDYLIKPFTGEKLREKISSALSIAREMKDVISYQPTLGEEEHHDAIIGKSEPMQGVFKTIGQVAASDATVLITGESGTGKELVARAIHSHSHRHQRPFTAVNCAAIPETLLESELFGFEKGAFTGANSRRAGKFEQANNGTLFLDEIGDMTLATQTKILRVLQSGTFERVGGNETLKVDVRIIAATNQDLERMMEEGTFRPDLFFRLNVVRVKLPSLRDRPEDIPLLIEYFMRRYSADRGGRPLQISAAAMEKLGTYEWPGNVRELENVIRTLALTVKKDTILPSDIRLAEEPVEERQRSSGSASPRNLGAFSPGGDRERRLIEPLRPSSPPAAERHEDSEATFQEVEEMLEPLFHRLVDARDLGEKYSTFDVVERALIVHALNQTEGNQLRAAKELGITRSTLRKRIQRYGITISTTVRTGNT